MGDEQCGKRHAPSRTIFATGFSTGGMKMTKILAIGCGITDLTLTAVSCLQGSWLPPSGNPSVATVAWAATTALLGVWAAGSLTGSLVGWEFPENADAAEGQTNGDVPSWSIVFQGGWSAAKSFAT
jgi:hypothetical protein